MPQDPQIKAIAKREPKAEHHAFQKWIKTNTGLDLDVDTLTAALRLHPEFRKTEVYQTTRAKAQEARQAELAAQHQRGIDREQARLDKLREQQAAIEAKLAGKATPVEKGTAKAKAVAKTAAKPKATPAPKAEPKPEPVAEKAAPAKPARGRAAAKAKEATEATVTPISDRPRGRRGRPAPAADVDNDDVF